MQRAAACKTDRDVGFCESRSARNLVHLSVTDLSVCLKRPRGVHSDLTNWKSSDV